MVYMSQGFVGTQAPDEHFGVICDGCQLPVCGIRHKCDFCPNYDICTKCRQNGVHNHHTMHEIRPPPMAYPSTTPYPQPPPTPTQYPSYPAPAPSPYPQYPAQSAYPHPPTPNPYPHPPAQNTYPHPPAQNTYPHPPAQNTYSPQSTQYTQYPGQYPQYPQQPNQYPSYPNQYPSQPGQNSQYPNSYPQSPANQNPQQSQIQASSSSQLGAQPPTGYPSNQTSSQTSQSSSNSSQQPPANPHHPRPRNPRTPHPPGPAPHRGRHRPGGPFSSSQPHGGQPFDANQLTSLIQQLVMSGAVPNPPSQTIQPPACNITNPGDLTTQGWNPPQAGNPCNRQPLQSSDPEYQAVIRRMNDNGGASWTAKVILICRIENYTLFNVYKSCKADMDREHGPGFQNEHTLWHGTSADVLENIYRGGFNRSYCGKNATAYGNGVYFATSFSYSASSSYSPPDAKGQKYIFQCRVLTGHFTAGQQGLKEPPMRTPELRYDSVVDKTGSPNMYIVFKDMQVYPEYVITLKA